MLSDIGVLAMVQELGPPYVQFFRHAVRQPDAVLLEQEASTSPEDTGDVLETAETTPALGRQSSMPEVEQEEECTIHDQSKNAGTRRLRTHHEG